LLETSEWLERKEKLRTRLIRDLERLKERRAWREEPIWVASDTILNDRIRRTEDEIKDIERKIEVICRESAIFEKVREVRRGRGYLRKIFCVYRLFTYYGFTLDEIYQTLGDLQAVKHIGQAFKYTCISTRSCWAKPFLDMGARKGEMG